MRAITLTAGDFTTTVTCALPSCAARGPLHLAGDEHITASVTRTTGVSNWPIMSDGSVQVVADDPWTFTNQHSYPALRTNAYVLLVHDIAGHASSDLLLVQPNTNALVDVLVFRRHASTVGRIATLEDACCVNWVFSDSISWRSSTRDAMCSIILNDWKN